ncbi:hypothetical protein C7C45_14340 [Micromonospora arborensis]|uniref:Uncharacterized protein n=1 Tax=Micromonospora arborensis TaxID=2116518 RepID=A0A318NJU6_9ACTN|nr:hypothetical protein [Micromonospora arborensis]PYC70540.1 hypothetical protein C7C45_14340 [Micromonospora arborensis]
MLIDCDGCARRGDGCSGCLLAALFDETSPAAGLVAAEVEAIEVLARAGFDVEVLSAPTRPGAARHLGHRRVA